MWNAFLVLSLERRHVFNLKNCREQTGSSFFFKQDPIIPLSAFHRDFFKKVTFPQATYTPQDSKVSNWFFQTLHPLFCFGKHNFFQIIESIKIRKFSIKKSRLLFPVLKPGCSGSHGRTDYRGRETTSFRPFMAIPCKLTPLI